MRWRKIFLTTLVALAVVLNAIAFGYAVTEGSNQELAIAALQLVFSVYALSIAAISIFQDSVDGHWNAIIHLTALTTVASLLLGSAAILPSTPFPTPRQPSSILRVFAAVLGSEDDDAILEFIWYTITGLYIVICAVAFTTPLGPPLHYPPELIYPEKQVKAITNTDPENVCGIYSSSPWDVLMFSYTTKVVWLGYRASSMEIGDLPIVPYDMRAAFNYSRMRQAMRTFQLKVFGWTPKPGSGWQLVYRLLRLNWVAFLAEFLLAVVSAGLFYVPAFFMRGFISYLEVDPFRIEKGWGWFYVFGLFMSNAISFLGMCSAYRLFHVLSRRVSHWPALVSRDDVYPSSLEDSAQYFTLLQDSGPQRRRFVCCQACRCERESREWSEARGEKRRG